MRTDRGSAAGLTLGPEPGPRLQEVPGTHRWQDADRADDEREPMHLASAVTAALGAPVQRQPVVRRVFQAALGGALLFAGTGHLTFARTTFRAQVPTWFPMDPDLVVLASGVVELVLGSALVLLVGRPRRVALGWLVAAFFVAVFPGNISQLVTRTDAFGLDTDTSRAVRLAFQPVLVAWALWSTQAWGSWRHRSEQAAPAGP